MPVVNACAAKTKSPEIKGCGHIRLVTVLFIISPWSYVHEWCTLEKAQIY